MPHHLLRWAAGFAVVLAGALAVPPGGGAQVGSPLLARFDLSARADAVGLETDATGLPIIPEGKAAFLTPASAQARLSSFGSFGDSSAFASAPYPGEFLVSLPNTANGLGAGTLPPFPSYPFYVSADPSRPERTESFGPYSISARSENAGAEAVARLGLSTTPPQIASITSRAAVRQDPGSEKLTSVAVSEIAPFGIGELVRIGDIRSTATLTFDPAAPDAKVAKTTTFSIGTITVAGTEVGITRAGLTMAGKPVVPVDASALERQLADAGITIEYLPGSETDTSITSAALQITLRGNYPITRDTTVRLVVGQVSATAAPVRAEPLTGALPELPSTTDEASLLGAEPVGAGSGAAIPGSDLGFSERDDGGFGSTAGTASGSGVAAPVLTTPVPPSSVPAQGVLLPGAPATRRIPPLTDPAPAYALVAVALVAAVLGSRFTAVMSARSR
ncbi:MAG: hypothetical protein AB1679_04525 [Actinomycetota bacterium]|jgi:hypothetical protein